MTSWPQRLGRFDNGFNERRVIELECSECPFGGAAIISDRGLHSDRMAFSVPRSDLFFGCCMHGLDRWMVGSAIPTSDKTGTDP